MMRRGLTALAGLALALTCMSPLAALAAGSDKFDVEVTPVYFSNATGDALAPPPPGYFAAYCPGYNGVPVPPSCGTDSPRTTNNFRLDYGLTYHFSRKLNLAYTHDNLDFSLGRITSIAPLSILTGDIDDRTDTIALNYLAGHGLSMNAHWSSHERSNIAATASPVLGGSCYFNAEQCTNGLSNPASINSNDYGIGVAYNFGPHTRFEPQMFKASVDVNFYPRPHGQSAANCVAGGGIGSNAPACGAESVDGYVGSQFVEPYSLTMFPLADTHLQPGLLPFVSIGRAAVLFHAENTPEMFNTTAFGIIKVLGKGLTFNWTNLHLNGCLCSDTVPPPDSVRFDVNIFKLTYGFHL